jgi:hypothetical protein
MNPVVGALAGASLVAFSIILPTELLAQGSASGALESQAKKYDWKAVTPPSTSRFPVGTVWLRVKKKQPFPICAPGSKVAQSAFVDLSIEPGDDVWETGTITKDRDFSIMANLDAGIVSSNTGALSAAAGFKRVKSYTVEIGGVKTEAMVLDPTGTSVEGVRLPACGERVAALRKNKKAFKNLMLVTHSALAENVTVNFELNPLPGDPKDDATKSETPQADGQKPAPGKPDAPKPADAAKDAAAKVAAGDAPATPPAADAPASGDGKPAEGGDKPAEPAPSQTADVGPSEDPNRCGWYFNAGGKVLTGVGVKLKLQACKRASMTLAFEDPHFIGFNAMSIVDYEELIDGEFTEPRHGFRLKKSQDFRGGGLTAKEAEALIAGGLVDPPLE